MKLELRKRKQPNLKKLVKATQEGEVVAGETPVYILLEEAEGNVLKEGTSITPEVIEKVNWKDAEGIEFVPMIQVNLPSAKEGIVQIVSKPNGEIWCIPALGTAEAFHLGYVNLEDLIKKYETNYIQGRTFEFFVLDKEAKFFAKRTRIGAIPVREQETKEFETDGTYIDINNSGNIVMFIKGAQAHEFTKDKVLLKNKLSTIGINSSGTIKLDATEANESVKVEGATFSISSKNTDVQEADLENGVYTKFNCHTKLDNASFGNKDFRLQFYPDRVKLQNISQDKKLFEIDGSGNIAVKGVKIPLDHPLGFYSRVTTPTEGALATIGSYVTGWQTSNGGDIQFRESNGKLNVGIDGEFFQNEGKYKVIDENSVNPYIDNYMNINLGNKINNYLNTHLESQMQNYMNSHIDAEIEAYLNTHLESQMQNYMDSYTETTVANYLNTNLPSKIDGYLNSNLGSKIENYLNANLGYRISAYLNANLGNRIETYLDSHLEEKMKNLIRTSYKKKNEFSGNATSLVLGFDQNRWYQIDFSQASNSGIHSFIAKGSDINAGTVIVQMGSLYFKIIECVPDDEQYDNYFEIRECDRNGNPYRSCGYFRDVYLLD